MRTLISAVLLLVVTKSFAQNAINKTTDTSKMLRAFPITSYMVDLNDSIRVVQIEMPDGIHIPENELGILYGVYKTSRTEAVSKGYGRCHLIKGNFHYFTIGHNDSGIPIAAGDIIYVFMKRATVFDGLIPKLSSHFIQLQDVYETRFYDRYLVFSNWSEADEKTIIDSMVKDIRFTGDHFLTNYPGQDKTITIGRFKDRKVFIIMKEATNAELINFLQFVAANPRLYAGREWKVTEVFATWLAEGAPLAD